MNRVVITGIGMITPYGIGFDKFARALFRREPVFTPIVVCDATRSKLQYAGQCYDLDSAPLMHRKVKKLVTRKDHLALAAAHNAWQSADLDTDSYNPDRAGAYVGACSTQIGDFFPYFDDALTCISDDRTRFDSSALGHTVLHELNPITALKVLSNGALAHISQSYNLRGPNTNIINFDTAGAESLQQAAESITAGRADICMAGAMYAPLDPFQIADGVVHQEWNTQTNNPDEAIRPYSSERSGTLPSETAVFFILEELAFATARGARIYAELTEWGHAAGGASPDGSALGGAISQLKKVPHQAIGCAHGHAFIDEWEQNKLKAVECKHSVYDFFGYPGETSALIQIACAITAYQNDGLTTSFGRIEPMCPILISNLNRFGGATAIVIEPFR